MKLLISSYREVSVRSSGRWEELKENKRDGGKHGDPAQLLLGSGGLWPRLRWLLLGSGDFFREEDVYSRRAKDERPASINT